MENVYGVTGNTFAVVDMQAIRRNVEKIQAHIGGAVTLLPVLKGNTCGHGLAEIAALLVNECGLDMLCVGQTIEAEQIRNAGIACDILVLGGTPFNNLPYVAAHNITTTLGNEAYARALSREAAAQGKTAKVHIKIDTGLGRMGARVGQELEGLLDTVKSLPGIEIEGAYTHFADSSKLDTSFIDRQATLFDQGIAQIRAQGIALRYCHAANTPAIVRFPQYHYNMVRSLLLLVGYDWSADEHNRLGLETALYWRGFVAQVNSFPKGESFDYGLSITAQRDMKVAVTSFGYTDGYPFDLPGRGAYVMVRGKRAPILSLNMDQGFIDVTDIPDVQVNDPILIFGKDGSEEIDLIKLLTETGAPYPFTYHLGMLNRRVRYVFQY